MRGRLDDGSPPWLTSPWKCGRLSPCICRVGIAHHSLLAIHSFDGRDLEIAPTGGTRGSLSLLQFVKPGKQIRQCQRYRTEIWSLRQRRRIARHPDAKTSDDSKQNACKRCIRSTPICDVPKGRLKLRRGRRLRGDARLLYERLDAAESRYSRYQTLRHPRSRDVQADDVGCARV